MVDVKKDTNARVNVRTRSKTGGKMDLHAHAKRTTQLVKKKSTAKTFDKPYSVLEPTTLLPFLISKLQGKGRNKVKALLTHGQIKVDDHVVTRHDHPLVIGQQVVVSNAKATDTEGLLGIQILFEDAYVIVINKPAGLLSIATEEEPERTAYRALTRYVRESDVKNRLFVVHRLDRETSGVMMYAKSEDIQKVLQENWKDTVLERSYVAVVEGRMKKEQAKITSWLKENNTRTMYVSQEKGDGLKAVTHYKVLQSSESYSLLEIKLETGRKNQIRVQLQHEGHSVVGDKRYGSRLSPIGRLGLHARVLAFRHPVTKEVMRFETEVPSLFRKVFLPK